MDLPPEQFQRVNKGHGRSDGLSSDCRGCRAEQKREARKRQADAKGRTYRTRAEVQADAKERRRLEREARKGGVKVVDHTDPERVRQITDRKRERRHADPVYREAMNQLKRERYAVIGPRYLKDRALVAERDGWVCAICHGEVTRADWSLDHVVPLSEGGLHTIDNVVLAHKRCNSWRGAGRFDIEGAGA